MDEPGLIERQLRDLARELRLRPLRRRRLLGEVRGHLEDALEDELARGTPRREAERLVVERFGSVSGLATGRQGARALAAGLAFCAVAAGAAVVLAGRGEEPRTASPGAGTAPAGTASDEAARDQSADGELPSLVRPAPSDPPPAPAAIGTGVVAAGGEVEGAEPTPPAQPAPDGLLGVLGALETDGFRELGNGRRVDLFGPATLVSVDPRKLDLSKAARLVVGRRGSVQPVGFSRSPDGKTVAVIVSGSAVQFVDAATFRAGKTIALVDQPRPVSWSADQLSYWGVWSVHWLEGGLVAIHLQQRRLPAGGRSPFLAGQIVVVDPAAGAVVGRIRHERGNPAEVVGVIGDELVAIRRDRGRVRGVLRIGIDGGIREIRVTGPARGPRSSIAFDPERRRLHLVDVWHRITARPPRLTAQVVRVSTVELDAGGVARREIVRDVDTRRLPLLLGGPARVLPDGALLLEGFGNAVKIDTTTWASSVLDLGAAPYVTVAGETILASGNFRAARRWSPRCRNCGVGVTAYDLDGRKLWHALGVRKVHRVEAQGRYALVHVAFAHNKRPGYVVVLDIATGRALGRLDVPTRPGGFSLVATARL